MSWVLLGISIQIKSRKHPGPFLETRQLELSFGTKIDWISCFIVWDSSYTSYIFPTVAARDSRFFTTGNFMKSLVARGSRDTRILFILGTSRKIWSIWILSYILDPGNWTNISSIVLKQKKFDKYLLAKCLLTPYDWIIIGRPLR